MVMRKLIMTKGGSFFVVVNICENECGLALIDKISTPSLFNICWVWYPVKVEKKHDFATKTEART